VISLEPPPVRRPTARVSDHTHSLSRLIRPRHWVKNAFVLAPAVCVYAFLPGR
jgi:4-hydroxybenzoate polyprenyltransferase